MAAGRLAALLLRGQHPDGLDGGAGAEFGLGLPGDLPLRHEAVDLCREKGRRRESFFKIMWISVVFRFSQKLKRLGASTHHGEQDPTLELKEVPGGCNPKQSPSWPPLTCEDGVESRLHVGGVQSRRLEEGEPILLCEDSLSSGRSHRGWGGMGWDGV